ncbi:hypothetical protein EJ08DRAFT_633377 [Tothia fuscella]|uniref:Uncharacterized protein n=1 Tax=Tothia fuscella TaxID=1048955 RepID=A0A9P4NSY4_9PEZI|nr:hypothetical protein EJ08DRAFT_633377 [Tothia fuscella]
MVGGFSPAASPGGQPTPQFQFTPESVVAQPGDTVRFMFMGMNHSVVQTSFDAPCQPMANGQNTHTGFTSGVQPNPSNQLAGAPTVDLPIKSTDPLFMSTLSTQSCNLGMVFTVNPPQDRNLVLFKSNALKSSVAGTLKNAQIIAAGAPPAQVASTISIAPQGNGNAAATPAAPGGPQASGVQQGGAAPSVIAGQGQTGNGQACGCMCLCGAGSFPANAGQGAFGGTLGAMPGKSLSPVNVTPTIINQC